MYSGRSSFRSYPFLCHRYWNLSGYSICYSKACLSRTAYNRLISIDCCFLDCVDNLMTVIFIILRQVLKLMFPAGSFTKRSILFFFAVCKQLNIYRVLSFAYPLLRYINRSFFSISVRYSKSWSHITANFGLIAWYTIFLNRIFNFFSVFILFQIFKCMLPFIGFSQSNRVNLIVTCIKVYSSGSSFRSYPFLCHRYIPHLCIGNNIAVFLWPVYFTFVSVRNILFNSILYFCSIRIIFIQVFKFILPVIRAV